MAKQYRKPNKFGPRRPNFVRAWREFREMSEDELAEAMGTSKSTVQRTETGAQGYTQDFIEAAADVLGCEPWDLMMHPPSDAASDREWMTEIAALSKQDRREALGHIRVIRQSRRN